MVFKLRQVRDIFDPLERKWMIAVGSGVLLVAAVAVAAFVWLKAIFNEPSAEVGPSLSAHLEAKSILAIFAHPDDEITSAGFLSEAARRHGVTVRIITATKGESGHPHPPICRPEDLGTIREAETLKDGFALGVETQEVWSFPDGKLVEVSPEELVLAITTRLRKWRPDVVLTFDPLPASRCIRTIWPLVVLRPSTARHDCFGSRLSPKTGLSSRAARSSSPLWREHGTHSCNGPTRPSIRDRHTFKDQSPFMGNPTNASQLFTWCLGISAVVYSLNPWRRRASARHADSQGLSDFRRLPPALPVDHDFVTANRGGQCEA